MSFFRPFKLNIALAIPASNEKEIEANISVKTALDAISTWKVNLQ